MHPYALGEAVSSATSCSINWSAVEASAVIVLVGITVYYALQTNRLAKQTAAMARETENMAVETKKLADETTRMAEVSQKAYMETLIPELDVVEKLDVRKTGENNEHYTYTWPVKNIGRFPFTIQSLRADILDSSGKKVNGVTVDGLNVRIIPRGTRKVSLTYMRELGTARNAELGVLDIAENRHAIAH